MRDPAPPQNCQTGSSCVDNALHAPGREGGWCTARAGDRHPSCVTHQPPAVRGQLLVPADDFLTWLSKYRPQLSSYETRLRRDGWDTLDSLRLLTAEDMSDLNILPGHRRLLVDTLKDL